MDVIMQRYKFCIPLVVYQFCCMALYHSQMRRPLIDWFSLAVDNITCIVSMDINLEGRFCHTADMTSLHYLYAPTFFPDPG